MSSLIRNIGWLGAANVLVKPFWFIFVTAVLMRVLGAEGYGVLSATMALAGLVLTFTDLGMARFTARAVARDRTKASPFMSNFLVLRSGLILLALVVAVCAGWALGYTGVALSALFFAAVFTATLDTTSFLRSLYEAVEALKAEAVLLVIEKALVIGFGMLFVFTVRQADWALAGMALGMVIASGLHIVWLHKRIAPLRLKSVSKEFMREKLALMIPFGLAGIFNVAYYKIDLVMVEAMLGESEAGQYGAAFRILEALSMLPSVVVLSGLFPRLTRLDHQDDHAGFRKLFLTGFASLMAASLVVAVTLAILAPELIFLLSPDATFAPAAGALRVLLWTFPLASANFLLYSVLVVRNQERFLSMALLAILVFNFATNLLAIPAFGIEGAAVTTVASEILLALTYYIRYRKKRP